MTDTNDAVAFSSLGLPAPVLQAVVDLGYETPSPIQVQSIPHLLEGRDILGQAQTGTGKTAAFALPLLARLDPNLKKPQIMVLAPTRELAIQVAEAFQSYARHLKGFTVLPIYGGQSYDGQLRQLKRGAQVVVGTPGRMMDHMRRGTLKLDALQAIVLDEADEMLRMGFIDDVEWILEKTPASRQTALFSATLPPAIARVAQKYLRNPIEIKIKTSTTTAKTIRQRYWLVEGLHKLDALTRLLEAEPTEGMIIFVRTKNSTVELAEKLTARGYACDALNGDIPQAQRERVVERLKSGKLDIVVATDVAARGLDVERISHVINYDIPHDNEAYVHRIGRTGRAGRSGEAILFVARRELRLLKSIERTTKQSIEPIVLPTVKDINELRVAAFKEKIVQTIEEAESNPGLAFYQTLITELLESTQAEPEKVAAALAFMAQGESPLLLKEGKREKKGKNKEFSEGRQSRGDRDRTRENSRDSNRENSKRPRRKESDDVNMERFRIDVGYNDEVKPGNIVGAIANEAEIDSQYIGQIEIFEEYSLVDLPTGMPDEIHQILKKARICQKPMGLTRWDGQHDGSAKAAGAKRPQAGRSERGEGKGDYAKSSAKGRSKSKDAGRGGPRKSSSEGGGKKFANKA